MIFYADRLLKYKTEEIGMIFNEIQAKKDHKTIIIIFLIVLLIFLLLNSLFTAFAFLIFNRAKFTRSVRLNGMAENVGMEIDREIDSFHFPKGETIILSGRCFEDRSFNWNILIYANEYINEDIVIGDYDKNNDELYYWTLKIEDGEISEVWIGKNEIDESDMRKYTREEQYEHMYFVVPLLSPVRFHEHGFIDSDKVYGYHCFNKK